MQPALCALGAVLLSFGIPWLAVPAALCALAAAALPPAFAREGAPRSLALAQHPAAAQVVFGIGFLRGLYWLLFEQSLVPPQRLDGFRGLTLFAFIVGSAYLCVHLRASLEKARFWALVVLFVVLDLALDAGVVSLLEVLMCGVAVGRSGARSKAGARAVAVFTPELAALFLLYQQSTWFETLRPALAAYVAGAIALAAVLAVVSSGRIVRVVALGAAIYAALICSRGGTAVAFWICTAVLCSAAAGFARASQSERLAVPAR